MVMTPIFAIVDPILSLLYGAPDPIDPLFLQKKISLCLSHLVPEINGDKGGLI